MAELRCPRCKPKDLQEFLWMKFIDLQLRTQEIPHVPCTLPNIQVQIGSILTDSINFTERINNSHLLLSPADYTTLHHKNYALQTNLRREPWALNQGRRKQNRPQFFQEYF